jgi:hemoglobin
MHKILLLGALTFALLPTAAHAEIADSLYARLGGEPVMARVVDQTIDEMVGNPLVNQSFDRVNLKRLKGVLAEYLCSLSGGGCVYGGDEIGLVHRGLKITEREFYALVEALRAALDRNGVGNRDKNELLAILAPLKRLVVTQ